MKVAAIESLFASVSLIIHVGIIITSVYAIGSAEYTNQFKCWVEIAITLVDAFNLWLSISFLEGAQEDSDPNSTRWIVALGGVTVLLHAVRIFHVFYTTLKPNKTQDSIDSTQHGTNKVSSIQGIFISRNYAGMKFCFDQLVQPLEEGRSKNFSLQFYGTQERARRGLSVVYSGSADEDEEIRLSSIKRIESLASIGGEDCYSFHRGRPDWESIFHEAIRKTQLRHTSRASDEISIGVFFCGSPAIAKCLRSTTDKVNAQHQFAAKKSKGKYRRCKIVVHIENY